MGRGVRKKAEARSAGAQRSRPSRAAERSERPETVQETHIPVLLEEVLSFFPPHEDGRYLDGTLGMAGHAKALLSRAREAGVRIHLLGLDRDCEALAIARENLAPFGDAAHTAHARFSEFEAPMRALGWEGFDGALVDIGVSSLQLDTPERGFSFLREGPLDMRMDQGMGSSAHALVNRASVAQLKDIIERYGEDPMAGRIARAIDSARSQKPIESTSELARIIEEAYPAKWRATSRNHPATRAFQALRMAVNEEPDELSGFLESIVPWLKPGGRVAVITFHSLEDRIVKHFFREQAAPCRCPGHVPVCVCGQKPSLRILTKKPVLPLPEEISTNPRAGSAKLRVAEKL